MSDNELYILQLLAEEEEEDRVEDDLLICQAAAAGVLIYLEASESRQRRNQRRQRLYLTRNELLPDPRRGTPWQRLYERRNTRAFITTMGIDVPTFEYILEEFRAVWDSTPIPRGDAPGSAAPRLSLRSLNAAGALGLILHYLNSTMADVSLMQIFALIPSTVSRYIHFLLSSSYLYYDDFQNPKFDGSKGEEFQENNDLIVARHPLLTGAFGSMDGLNLAVQTSADQEIENATFNGWLHDHFVSSVLAFGATGVIIACKLNAPGSWHDSRVARTIYEKLRTQTPEGYYLVTDTAFPVVPIKLKVASAPRSKRELDFQQTPLNVHNCTRRIVNCCLIARQQNGEIRPFKDLLDAFKFPYQLIYSNMRADLLETIVRLYQIRTCMVGINQISTVYMDIWREDGQDRIWSDFANILFSEQRKNNRVAHFHLEEV